jgi:hypothetical protein
MIRISPREIAKLQARETELKKELTRVQAQLQAIRVLTGDDSPENGPRRAAGTMRDAIIELARKGPLPRKQLRPELEKLGYTGKSLGNYLYTAVKRLKAQKKITVMKDGSLTLP